MNSKSGLILFWLILLLHAGCAVKKQSMPRAPHDNLRIVHEIGIIVQNSGNSLMVRSVEAASPAREAGVEARDVILSVDGKKRTAAEYVDLIMAKKAAEHVLLTIQRKNDVIRFDIVSRETAMPPTVLAVRRLLSDERRVVLAVLSGKITIHQPEPSESWEDVMRTKIQGAFERRFAGLFGDDKRFSLVDRLELGPTVQEYHIMESGTVPDHARIRIRELTRATHILLVNFTRDPAGAECFDCTDASLIEAENGAILAHDHQETTSCR